MAQQGGGPPSVDPTRPSAARIYDYLLGGKDNYAVDRAAADQVLAVAPDQRRLARANRAFAIRAVRVLAEAGIRQFVDLGTGFPSSPSVHEMARQADPSARVVYVDYDRRKSGCVHACSLRWVIVHVHVHGACVALRVGARPVDVDERTDERSLSVTSFGAMCPHRAESAPERPEVWIQFPDIGRPLPGPSTAFLARFGPMSRIRGRAELPLAG
jgi:hypothetical protein